MLPVLLNVTGKRVVVIGGGAVGVRKANAALAVGATVCVVDPRTVPELPPQATHIAEAYRSEHLANAVLVFACATPEVNSQVVADAHALGLWVNAASDPHAGDFALPAVVRRGELTLAVSTGGASPALARRIREKLEADYDDAFAVWLRLLAELRAEVLATEPDESRRHAIFDSLANWHWLARVRTDPPATVLAAMRASIHGK